MACCNRTLTHTAQRILAEGIGSFILCFAIILSTETEAGSNAPTFQAVGYVLAALIYGLDHIASHFNPAVTLGAYLQGFLSLPLALAFVGSQVVGGTLGGVLGNLLRASPVPSFNPVDKGKAFAAEAMFTGALVLVMQAVGLYKNAKEPNSFFGIAIGFTVAAGAATVSKISGGCFNPAVGMAIDFATLSSDPRTFDDIWLYWLAPFTGAIIATVFSRGVNVIEQRKWAVPGWFCRCRCLTSRGGGGGGGGDDGGAGAAEDDGAMPFMLPVSEFIGTFFIVLVASLQEPGPNKALSIGFMVTAMVYALDHVCGADFNPAVTLGVALRMGRLLKDSGKILTVFLAQYAGAFAACIVTFILNGGVGGAGIQYPAPNGNTGATGAVFFEAAWTAFVVYTVCAVMTDTAADKGQDAVARRGHSRSYHGLAIGFVVVAGIFCGGAQGAGSGGVFNPACVGGGWPRAPILFPWLTFSPPLAP